MRQFTILVKEKTQKKWLAYPPLSGEKTLEGMETLHGRGFTVKASTTANGITEILSLENMKQIFKGNDSQVITS